VVFINAVCFKVNFWNIAGMFSYLFLF